MSEARLSEDFLKGRKYLAKGDMDAAAKAFESAYMEDMKNPMYMSYYGMCAALKWKKIGLGLELCTKAIRKEFYRPEYYLNLGRVYIAADNRKGAIAVAKKGLGIDPENDDLHDMLVELGVRRRSVIPFLGRSNPLNRFLGVLFRRRLPDLLRRKGPPAREKEKTDE